ncbi:MAG: type II toxin-antitoxin system HicA family toxin [Proteobacteria bacterium]|nr:type II toxin-antitoxin system HicA family toxin [Pseudomonadota bacterium]
MTKLRLVPYRDLKKVLAAKGFHWLRCEGSHNVFRHESGRIVVLPDHGSQVIVRPLLRKILRDLNLSPEEYHRLLDEL